MVIVYNLWSCGLSGGRPYRGEANLGSFNRNNQMSCFQNIILLRIKTCQCISTWHCAPILEVDPNPELISPFFGFFTLSVGSSIPWRSRLRVLQLKQSNVMFIKIHLRIKRCQCMSIERCCYKKELCDAAPI